LSLNGEDGGDPVGVGTSDEWGILTLREPLLRSSTADSLK
jgi:hypothetical protein